MSRQLTPRVLAIDALALVAAFPASWLVLIAAHWDASFRNVVDCWITAVWIYCVVRIVQLVIHVKQPREPVLAVSDLTDHPEFASDKSTDRLTVWNSVPGSRRTSWILLGQSMFTQIALVLWRIVPYFPVCIVIGVGAYYLSERTGAPIVLMAVYSLAGWTAFWVIWATFFSATFARIDQFMEDLFWAIWPW